MILFRLNRSAGLNLGNKPRTFEWACRLVPLNYASGACACRFPIAHVEHNGPMAGRAFADVSFHDAFFPLWLLFVLVPILAFCRSTSITAMAAG